MSGIDKTPPTFRSSDTSVATTQPGTASGSLLRARLGAALQRHRLRRGLTQSQLAEFAQLSLKYVGEIERGEANTTLDALERLADAVGWDPMDALEGLREPITEGVRVLLISETEQIFTRLQSMVIWLRALDPERHPDARLPPATPHNPHVQARARARPRRRSK